MSHHLNIMGRQSVGKFDHSFISSSQMGKLKRIMQLMHKLLISSTLLLLLMWTWDLSKPNFPVFFPCSDLRIDCIYHSNNLPLSFSNSYNLQKAGAGCDKNHWNPPNRFLFFKANPFRCSLTLKIISHRERLKMLSFFFSSPLSRLKGNTPATSRHHDFSCVEHPIHRSTSWIGCSTASPAMIFPGSPTNDTLANKPEVCLLIRRAL